MAPVYGILGYISTPTVIVRLFFQQSSQPALAAPLLLPLLLLLLLMLLLLMLLLLMLLLPRLVVGTDEDAFTDALSWIEAPIFDRFECKKNASQASCDQAASALNKQIFIIDELHKFSVEFILLPATLSVAVRSSSEEAEAVLLMEAADAEICIRWKRPDCASSAPADRPWYQFSVDWCWIWRKN